MTTTIDIRRLRLALVDTEDELTTAAELFEQAKASLTKDAKIKATTKDARDAEIAVLCGDDPLYKGTHQRYRQAQYQHKRADALLEAAKDERRAQEWQIRAKLADGLLRQQVQSDADDPAGDNAFDDTADNWLDFMETNGR